MLPADCAAAGLGLFTVFHLNLMFSALEEADRATVITRCYHPILDAAETLGLPLGIEATGLTLEIAGRVDPGFVSRLRALCTAGVVEFVGSGYAQIIGPLVPPEVNRRNLELGQIVARRLLGVTPRLALVGEQAWSAGLVSHYREAGFAGVILEFENSQAACGLPGGTAQAPARTQGPRGDTIPVLFNQCVAFQKFQRYAHGEIGLPDILAYLEAKIGPGPVFSLYGNDAEIFDYRLGRFATEAALAPGGEWRRITDLFATLARDSRFRFLSPSAALTVQGDPETAPLLPLTAAAQPCVVKKQPKYNISRWAVTGRDDLRLNATAHFLAASLPPGPATTPGARRDWKNLLTLFASDFRTHITDKRWRGLGRRKLLRQGRQRLDAAMLAALPPFPQDATPPQGITVHHDGASLTLGTPTVVLDLLPRKGLAIREARFPGVAPGVLAGTIPHGYFEDIALSADFFSGHLTYETPGRPKITDLLPVSPRFARAGGTLAVGYEAALPMGRLRKTVTVWTGAPRLDIAYDLACRMPLHGSLRLFHITLPPDSYDRDTLFFRACQGGAPETFFPRGRDFSHGQAVSFLVSASQGIGASDGVIELGDKDKFLRARVETPGFRPLGLVTYREIGETFFFRLAFSAQEIDETSRPQKRGNHRLALRLSLEAVAQTPCNHRSGTITGL